MAEDGAKRARASTVSPTKEQKYSVKGEFFRAENVKTKERAHMLALSHALGMAYGTVKKNGTKEGSHVEEVKTVIPSTSVAETVNHHVQDSPESLEDIAETNDRVMIGRVTKHVRKVFRRGVNVSITVSDEQDITLARARARARTLAKQRGGKACKSRRRRERAKNDGPDRRPNGRSRTMSLLRTIQEWRQCEKVGWRLDDEWESKRERVRLLRTMLLEESTH